MPGGLVEPGAVCGPEGREPSQGALGDGVWWGGLCASIIVHSGVWREWWIGGQTSYSILQGVMRRGYRVVGPPKKGSYVLGAGREGKPKCVIQVLFSSHQTTERRDPRRVSWPVNGDSRVSRLHHFFRIKTRDRRALCCVVVDSEGCLLFNEATQM